jgi:formate-dependent nitrite reductase membrane component NrfD
VLFWNTAESPHASQKYTVFLRSWHNTVFAAYLSFFLLHAALWRLSSQTCDPQNFHVLQTASQLTQFWMTNALFLFPVLLLYIITFRIEIFKSLRNSFMYCYDSWISVTIFYLPILWPKQILHVEVGFRLSSILHFSLSEARFCDSDLEYHNLFYMPF